jgi:hypothetical protein
VAQANGIDLIYATLYDAPIYSLIVLGISEDENSLKVLFEHSLAVDMELEQTRRFCFDKIIAEGKVFSDLNSNKKPSQDDSIISD